MFSCIKCFSFYYFKTFFIFLYYCVCTVLLYVVLFFMIFIFMSFIFVLLCFIDYYGLSFLFPVFIHDELYRNIQSNLRFGEISCFHSFFIVFSIKICSYCLFSFIIDVLVSRICSTILRFLG